MNECDIVITCSKFEAFGRTPLEAMMLGKPVICPNLGGSTEYVIDQKNGFYYTPGNPEELLNCIEKFILNPSLMKEFGENGKKHAMMIFNKSNFGDKVFTELKNILRTENNLIKIPYSINNYIEDDNIHINIKKSVLIS